MTYPAPASNADTIPTHQPDHPRSRSIIALDLEQLICWESAPSDDCVPSRPHLGTHEGDPRQIDGAVGIYARRLSDGVEIRACESDDIAAVLRLWGKERSGHASIPDRSDDVERLVGDSPAALFVAELEGEIVGALIAAWDGWRGNLYRLAVSSGHRRQGIGLALTRAGEEYLRQRGARRVTALVAFDDEVAAGFWDSAGYPLDREIGRRVRNI